MTDGGKRRNFDSRKKMFKPFPSTWIETVFAEKSEIIGECLVVWTHFYAKTEIITTTFTPHQCSNDKTLNDKTKVFAFLQARTFTVCEVCLLIAVRSQQRFLWYYVVASIHYIYPTKSREKSRKKMYWLQKSDCRTWFNSTESLLQKCVTKLLLLLLRKIIVSISSIHIKYYVIPPFFA